MEEILLEYLNESTTSIFGFTLSMILLFVFRHICVSLAMQGDDDYIQSSQGSGWALLALFVSIIMVFTTCFAGVNGIAYAKVIKTNMNEEFELYTYNNFISLFGGEEQYKNSKAAMNFIRTYDNTHTTDKAENDEDGYKYLLDILDETGKKYDDWFGIAEAQ